MSTRSIDALFAVAGGFATGARRHVDRPMARPRAFPDCACGFTVGGPRHDVYNETAFRFFLDIERERAYAGNQRFILLLVDTGGSVASPMEIDAQTAPRLIGALADCVRETDFVGWFRDGAVAGAVLTQFGESGDAESQQTITARVRRALAARLSASMAPRLRVRVYQSPTALLKLT